MTSAPTPASRATSAGGTWASTSACSSPASPPATTTARTTRRTSWCSAASACCSSRARNGALQAWDFVHCPPWTEHVFVGAGDGPCAVLAVGSRTADRRSIRYPTWPSATAPASVARPATRRGLRRRRRRRRDPLPGRLAARPLDGEPDDADLDGRPSWSPAPTPGSGAPPQRRWPPAAPPCTWPAAARPRPRPVRDAIAAATGNDRPAPALARPRRPGVGPRVRRRVPDDRRAAARPGQQRRPGRQARDDRRRLRAGLRHQPRRARSCSPTSCWTVCATARRHGSSPSPPRATTASTGSTSTPSGAPTRTRTAFHEYCVSKLANVLHSQELARRLEGSGVTTYSLHPGTIASDVWREVPWPIRPLLKMRMRSPAEGARTSLYCATSPEVAGDTGLYYDNCRARSASRHATPGARRGVVGAQRGLGGLGPARSAAVAVGQPPARRDGQLQRRLRAPRARLVGLELGRARSMTGAHTSHSRSICSARVNSRRSRSITSCSSRS